MHLCDQASERLREALLSMPSVAVWRAHDWQYRGAELRPPLVMRPNPCAASPPHGCRALAVGCSDQPDQTILQLTAT